MKVAFRLVIKEKLRGNTNDVNPILHVFEGTKNKCAKEFLSIAETYAKRGYIAVIETVVYDK